MDFHQRPYLPDLSTSEGIYSSIREGNASLMADVPVSDLKEKGFHGNVPSDHDTNLIDVIEKDSPSQEVRGYDGLGVTPDSPESVGKVVGNMADATPYLYRDSYPGVEGSGVRVEVAQWIKEKAKGRFDELVGTDRQPGMYEFAVENVMFQSLSIDNEYNSLADEINRITRLGKMEDEKSVSTERTKAVLERQPHIFNRTLYLEQEVLKTLELKKELLEDYGVSEVSRLGRNSMNKLSEMDGQPAGEVYHALDMSYGLPIGGNQEIILMNMIEQMSRNSDIAYLDIPYIDEPNVNNVLEFIAKVPTEITDERDLFYDPFVAICEVAEMMEFSLKNRTLAGIIALNALEAAMSIEVDNRSHTPLHCVEILKKQAQIQKYRRILEKSLK